MVNNCQKAIVRYVPLMQLQVKVQKTAEITYLEANNQQIRYPLTYLEVLK